MFGPYKYTPPPVNIGVSLCVSVGIYQKGKFKNKRVNYVTHLKLIELSLRLCCSKEYVSASGAAFLANWLQYAELTKAIEWSYVVATTEYRFCYFAYSFI